MNMKPSALPFSLIVWTLVLALPCFTQPAAGELEMGVGEKGLTELRWDGEDLLAEGKPEVWQIVLESKSLNDEGVNEYEFEKVSGEKPKVSFDRGENEITYAYDWGSVAFAYESRGDWLDVTTTIHNTSERTVAMFDITPLKLSLPESVDLPKGWNGRVDLPGAFNVVEAKFGDRKLLLGCATIMPLDFGFGKPDRKKNTLPVTFRGGVHMMEPDGVMYHHLGLPRIAPGEKLALRASLRLVDAEADRYEAAPDMVEAFREYHRPALVWKDRRPVGTIFLGGGRGPENNPRFWFKDQKLDVRTEAGRAELRERMMKQAEGTIGQLKAVDAQGMVLWDPEGSENPHPVTYIGDPRMVELIAPEMADIYPEYFKKFHEAGFRTGVCLRPSQVYLTPFTDAVDGDPESRWSVQEFPQWLELDLGKEQMIDKTQLIAMGDRAYQFTVEAKPEGGEYAVVVDRTGNTEPGTVESPITDEFKPVKARHVKLTVTGLHDKQSKWVSIGEFRVFAGNGENVALNKASDVARSFGRTVGGHVYHFDPKGNPLKDDFSDLRPEGVPDERFFPVVERLSRKIQFAKENWGCTLFYVDTNGVHRPAGENQKVNWALLDVHIWRDLQNRHPDVLIIPEFMESPGQLAYTAVYLQPPYSSPMLRDELRKLLPGAFGISQTVNLDREKWMELRGEFIEGIKAGDSMFFRAWFGDGYNPLIKELFDEVYKPGEENPGLPEAYLEQAEADEGAARR